MKNKRLIFRTSKRLPQKSALEWFEHQKAAFKVEARLLRYYSLPPLLENFGEFRQSSDFWILCYLEGEPAGALAFQTRKHVEITRLFVAPKFFRLGIASGLIGRLQGRYPGKSFLVATGARNTPARRLYAKCGFQEVEELETPDGVGIIKLVC